MDAQGLNKLVAGNYPVALPIFDRPRRTFLCDAAKRAGIREGWWKHNWRWNRCMKNIENYNEAAREYNTQSGGCRDDNLCRRNAYIKHMGPILPPVNL